MKEYLDKWAEFLDSEERALTEQTEAFGLETPSLDRQSALSQTAAPSPAQPSRQATRKDRMQDRFTKRYQGRQDRAKAREQTTADQEERRQARQLQQTRKQTARTLDQATRTASRVSPQGFTRNPGQGPNAPRSYTDREQQFMAANPQFDYGEKTEADRARIDAAPLRGEFDQDRQGRQDYRTATGAWDTYQHNTDLQNRQRAAHQVQQHMGIQQGLQHLPSYGQQDVAQAIGVGLVAPSSPSPWLATGQQLAQASPGSYTTPPPQLQPQSSAQSTGAPEPEGENPAPPPSGFYHEPRDPYSLDEGQGMKRHMNTWDNFIDRDILMEQNISIELSSFKAQEQLEPNVWAPSKTLDPEVRQRLITIAKKFWLSLNLPNVNIEDITFTGSLANYNWSKYSDVDLHILVDFTQLPGDNEIVEALMTAKRASWNRRHDITIHGYEVEIYVQDSNEVHHSTGVYSVLNDHWLVEPHKKRFTIDRENVTVKATHIMKQIDKIEEDFESGDYRKAMADVDRLKEKIRKFRKCGLEQSGEYSSENIAFKALRRNGYLEKLSNLKVNSYDKIMSL